MAEEIMQEINQIKGNYQSRFGASMDDLTASLIYELRQEVREKHTLVQFKNEKSALIFGIITRHLGAVTVSLSFLFSSLLVYTFKTTEREFMVAKRILSRYPNIEKFEPLFKSAKIIENRTGIYLIFASNNDSTQIGKEYFINKNKEAVVPLVYR